MHNFTLFEKIFIVGGIGGLSLCFSVTAILLFLLAKRQEKKLAALRDRTTWTAYEAFVAGTSKLDDYKNDLRVEASLARIGAWLFLAVAIGGYGFLYYIW